MDKFFTKKNCDRCGKDLQDGRIMSMFNEDCICMKCKDEETKHKDYNKARDREIEEVRKGNYNFKGIGFKDKKK
jgi:hypothetical protein